MTINFSLEKKDYVTFQLYNASRSERIRKRRRRNRLVGPVMFIILSAILLSMSFPSTKHMSGFFLMLAIAYFIVGILWYLFYPLWERRRYVKHFTAWVDDNYKHPFKEASITIEQDYILSKSDTAESKIATSQVEEICELPTVMIIKLENAKGFILSKPRLTNQDEIKAFLKIFAAHLNIPYREDINWEWK